MTKSLLLILTIVITLLLLPTKAHAQITSRTSYFDLIKQQMIQLTNGNITTITITPLQTPQNKIIIPTPATSLKITITPTPTFSQATPFPSKDITPTPSRNISPTKIPNGTTQEVNKPTPTPTKPPSTYNDQLSYIMVEINNYRASQGLSSVQKNDETCNFAATRAQELVSNFSHDGFTNRINNKSIPYATWSKVTENIAMTSDFKQVVTLWKNSSGHAANMRADTPYVCVRNSGNNYAYEGMKP